MKTMRLLEWIRENRPEHIARFGEACLVRHRNGKYELRGGTPDDRTAAKEWISLYMHEAVIDYPHTFEQAGEV